MSVANRVNTKRLSNYLARSLKAEEAAGPDHRSDTLMTAQNLAFVYHKQGQYKEAEQLYGLVFESREK